jgi:hypothetical protein
MGAIYQRHRPEKIVLYMVVVRKWPGVEQGYGASDVRFAQHVSSEFAKFFLCGILQNVFLSLRCKSCRG